MDGVTTKNTNVDKDSLWRQSVKWCLPHVLSNNTHTQVVCYEEWTVLATACRRPHMWNNVI
jgi:hypothetical protein